MLNGDFTAFASPACNGGVQRNLTGGFVNNQIDPARLSPIAQNFAKYLPVDQADQCGRCSTAFPKTTRTSGADQGRLHAEQPAVAFTRYLYAVYDNPATYDGKNVLTLSRTGQNNQAHSIVVGHNFVLSSFVNALRVTYNKTSTIARCRSSSPRPTSAARSTARCPVTWASTSPATASRSATAAPIPATSIRTAGSWPTTSTCQEATIRSRSAATGSTKIETLNNRPTNGAFTFNGQGTGLSLADFMMGALSGGSCRAIPSTTTTITTTSAPTSRTTGGRAERDRQRRCALGAVHPAAQHLQLGEQLRPGALRCRHQEQVYPQAPAGLLFPGDEGYPGRGTTEGKMAQFAPRLGAIWTPGGDGNTSIRAGWGVFYDTPHLFFNTRFANNPPWGAQITLSNPAGRLGRSVLDLSGGNPFPALNTGWATRRSRPSAST